MKPYPFAYFNQAFVPLEKACVSIASNSLQYGTTCFAGIKGVVQNGQIAVFRLKDHHARLMQATQILGIDYNINYQEFEEVMETLIQKNQPKENFYIRPFVFCPEEKLSPKPEGLSFQLGIYLTPLSQYFGSKKGMKLTISSWRKFSDNALPTKAKAGGCYVNAFVATGDAERQGFDEALLTDDRGFIVEASVANILIRYRGRILMPPVGSAALEGITQRTVIDLLKDHQIPFSFEPIDRSMVYACDELLLMGTAVQIAYAASVDGRPKKGPGPIFSFLEQEYLKILEGNHPRSKEWLTYFGGA